GNIRIRNQREVLIRLRTVSRTEQKRESIGILTLRIVVIFFRSEDVIKTNLARERGKIECERGRVDRTRNSERLFQIGIATPSHLSFINQVDIWPFRSFRARS